MAIAGVPVSSAGSAVESTHSAAHFITPNSAAAATRNERIDVIRLIAALGIIYIHAARSPTLDASRNMFRFAVPFYLFASLYYQANSLRRNVTRTFWQYVATRFKRLYLPFLAWSVIYLVARDLKRIWLFGLGGVALSPGMLWKGVEYHLWFLPFLFAWSIVLAVLYWSLLCRSRFFRWPIIAMAVAAGFVVAYCPMPANWNETFDNPTYAYVQYWRALPAACWALAFALLMTMGSKVHAVPRIIGVFGLVLTLSCSILQARHGILLIPRALTGLGAMLVALAPWRVPGMAPLARLGRYSYGIYLCHVLIAEIIRAVADHLHFRSSVALDLLMFAVGCVGSFAVVKLLASSNRTAWLNG